MTAEPDDISMAELLRRIDVGDEVFAWWPVRTYTCGGWYTSGWVWLKPALRKRTIGIRKYYYAKMPTTPPNPTANAADEAP
jgi:hypothetical protein